MTGVSNQDLRVSAGIAPSDRSLAGAGIVAGLAGILTALVRRGDF
jgi:hypothetical protein